MTETLQSLLAEVETATLETSEQAEAFRLRFIARKGLLAVSFDQFKAIKGPEKAATGKALNQLKNAVTEKLDEAEQRLAQTATEPAPPDLTLPGLPLGGGGRHPIAAVQRRIISAFARIGFEVMDGPEIEDERHNFSALNFEPDHPARDMQDTFFINADRLLRTHCTTVQVRALESLPLPIRAISPGRVYRNEAITARAHCFFNQIDGFYVAEGVSFADMRQTLLYFIHSLFGPQVKMRMRASYFPFTEISAEVDISCLLCGGEGCRVCKHTGWVEILGAGMIDPNVLDACGIDSRVYSGYAFGMGVERITMLLHGVPDLRLFTRNDVRFLRQTAAAAF